MTENAPPNAATDAETINKYADARTSRSIRFSDSEWKKVEKAAAERNDTTSEFVREAALTVAAGEAGSVGTVLPPGILELIKRTYRGTYILSTLKRDEMIREGRGEELDRTVQAARDIQGFLLDDISK